jgi:excisionase family DNA binding protein
VDAAQQQLMTVQEVAERLKTSTSFVYDLMASGELRHFVLGRGQGGKRVSEEQLQAYLASHEKGGLPASESPPVRRPTPRQGQFSHLPPS